MVRVFLFFLCFNLFSNINSQVQISNLIQDNYINKSESPKLYYVDFWATYCGPCIFVSKQLNVLQKQFPNDLYIISLTKENPELIRKFIDKNPTDLAVAIDYKGKAFDDFNVSFMPYGVLFNANGRVLWKGKAAEMNPKMVKKYLNRAKVHYSPSEFFPVIEEEYDLVEEDYLDEDFEIKEINDSSIQNLTEIKKSDYHMISGSSKSIIAYLSEVSEHQIKYDNYNDAYFEIKYKSHIEKSRLLNEFVLKANLNIVEDKKHSDVYFIDFNSDEMFWGENQIDWGEDTPNIMLSDADILADNVTLDEIMRVLSNVLKKPIVINSSNYNNEKLHDWEIHYQYFNLMKDNLLNYGITIKEGNTNLSLYMITKKDSQ